MLKIVDITVKIIQLSCSLSAQAPFICSPRSIALDATRLPELGVTEILRCDSLLRVPLDTPLKRIQQVLVRFRHVDDHHLPDIRDHFQRFICSASLRRNPQNLIVILRNPELEADFPTKSLQRQHFARRVATWLASVFCALRTTQESATVN